MGRFDKVIFDSDKLYLYQIAPPLTKYIENVPHMLSWRRNLVIGSKCDVVDSVDRWYLSTIVDINKSKNQVLCHFDQWSNRYDTWMSRDDPRIQLPLTVSNGGKLSGGGIKKRWTDLEPVLEDMEDPDQENIYAVWRVMLC